MIHLFAIFSLLLVCSDVSFAHPTKTISQILQEQQDREVRQKKFADLLEEAQSIEIDFVGNRGFSDRTFLEQMKWFSEPDQSGKLKRPSGWGCWAFLQDDLIRVQFFLGMKGHLQAKIGEPQVEDFGNYVKVTIVVYEGPRYRIGKLAVEGAKVFLPQEIIEMSGLVSGALIDASVIQDKIFKGLKDAYADRGYIQASVDFIPDFKLAHPLALEGIVDVTLEVDEGRMFLIERIDFTGKLSERVKANKQKLLDCLLLVDGDVYSRRLLNETLNNLNRLGWFEEIRDKDVIVRTSDRGSTLQIDIQVKEVDSPFRQ